MLDIMISELDRYFGVNFCKKKSRKQIEAIYLRLKREGKIK